MLSQTTVATFREDYDFAPMMAALNFVIMLMVFVNRVLHFRQEKTSHPGRDSANAAALHKTVPHNSDVNANAVRSNSRRLQYTNFDGGNLV